MRATVDRRCPGMVAIVEGIPYSIGPIALDLVRFQARPNVHGSAKHAKGEKDLLAEKVGIAFPGKPRNNFTEQAISQVGVLETLARSSHQVAIAPNRITHWWRQVRFILIEKLVMEWQSRCMVSDTANGRLFNIAYPCVQFAVPKIVVDGVIKVEQSALLEDHQCGRGNRLRDGGQRIERVWRRGDSALPISPPKSLLPKHGISLRDRDGEGRDAAFDHSPLNTFACLVKELTSLRRFWHGVSPQSCLSKASLHISGYLLLLSEPS